MINENNILRNFKTHSVSLKLFALRFANTTCHQQMKNNHEVCDLEK